MKRDICTYVLNKISCKMKILRYLSDYVGGDFFSRDTFKYFREDV